jgi:hypothetical protein
MAKYYKILKFTSDIFNFLFACRKFSKEIYKSVAAF